MHEYRHILFVSLGIADETESVKQALRIARANQAAMEFLVVVPELPASLSQYEQSFHESLKERLNNSVRAALSTLDIPDRFTPTRVEIECGTAPAIRVIRHVLRNAHDLVVMGVEPGDNARGFKAVSMELLRKCPCAVWLCRPIERTDQTGHIAVAVDPQSEGQAGHDLALKLLKQGRSLADMYDTELNIVSCWDYPLEEYLRGNVWIKMSEIELQKAVTDSQACHAAALDGLIHESSIGGTHQIHQVRGQPDKLIPAFIEDKKINVLVMGTVARTGIPGFIMGNTAENVLQKLSCSVLAVKPNGFVSPVRAY